MPGVQLFYSVIMSYRKISMQSNNEAKYQIACYELCKITVHRTSIRSEVVQLLPSHSNIFLMLTDIGCFIGMVTTLGTFSRFEHRVFTRSIRLFVGRLHGPLILEDYRRKNMFRVQCAATSHTSDITCISGFHHVCKCDN